MNKNIVKLSRKLWNSPTATGLLNKITGPLRLLLLTPLVVRLPELEIGVFGLLGTGVVLLNLLNGAIQKSFIQILTYAFSGATQLGPLGEGESRATTGTPQWDLFTRAYQTMFRLQILIGLPFLAIGAGVLVFGIGELTGWVSNIPQVWAAWALFILNQIFLLFTSRFQGALRAAGHVADINRVTALFNTASVVVGAVALVLTKSLMFLVAAQLVVAVAQRFVLIEMSQRRLPCLDARKKIISRDLEMEAVGRSPVIRNLISEITGRGFRSLVTIYIATYATVWGMSEVVSFNFSINLLMTLVGLSFVPLSNNVPFLTKNYLRGEKEKVRKKLVMYFLVSLVLFGSGALFIGTLGPWFLIRIDANVTLISERNWWIASVMYGLSMMNSCLEIFCNIDNRVQFLKYNIIAILIISSCMFLFREKLAPVHMIFLMTLPFLIIKGPFVSSVFYKRVFGNRDCF